MNIGFRQYSETIQKRFREYSERIQGGFRQDSEKSPPGFREDSDSERIQRGFRQDSERIQSGFREDSAKSPGGSREESEVGMLALAIGMWSGVLNNPPRRLDHIPMARASIPISDSSLNPPWLVSESSLDPLRIFSE